MSDSGEGSGWVVEPSEHTIRVVVDFPEDAPISADLRAALENLVRVLERETSGPAVEAEEPTEPETAGFQVFRPRPTPKPCTTQTKCEPQTITPCLARTIIDCTISPCTQYRGI